MRFPGIQGSNPSNTAITAAVPSQGSRPGTQGALIEPGQRTAWKNGEEKHPSNFQQFPLTVPTWAGKHTERRGHHRSQLPERQHCNKR
jgi:hypothetical protein